MKKMFALLVAIVFGTQFGLAEAKQSVSKDDSGRRAPRSTKPFINGNYVLGPTMKVNGYHSGAPVVVIVDKGSHYTHVLQLQKDTIARILSVSNSIGHSDTPTSNGRYVVVSKTLDPNLTARTKTILWERPKSTSISSNWPSTAQTLRSRCAKTSATAVFATRTGTS
jgi:hypothetical protein